MDINYRLLQVLGITVKDYESGEWGTASGKFQVPPSILRSFRTNVVAFCAWPYAAYSANKYDGAPGGQYQDDTGNKVINEKPDDILFPWVPNLWYTDTDGNEVNDGIGVFYNTGINDIVTSQYFGTVYWEERYYDDLVAKLNSQYLDNSDEAQPEWRDIGTNSHKKIYTVLFDVFDAERCFNEIAITYVQALFHKYKFLRMMNSPEALQASLLPSDLQLLKKAIYNAVEYASKNNQFWENINGSGYSQGNFSLTIDNTGWVLGDDMFGVKAKNYIENMDLEDYQVLKTSHQLIQQITPNGNLVVQTGLDSTWFNQE